MKAVVTSEAQKSIVKEIAEPVMNDDSVKIKIKYCGVCYSEHYDWKTHGGRFGHEPMGVVVEVGKNVKGFEVGDRVSGLWMSDSTEAGAMVQYAVANPETDIVVKIPDNVSDEDAVLEPLACLFSAVSKVRCSMPGQKVCVVGCGYMGCGAISLLKTRGCYVVAVDIRESSREAALRYGADEAYTPEEALDKFGMKPGMNPFRDEVGFEYVMEWAETNESLDTAINLTRMCGQLCIGAYHTGEKRLVDMQQLNVKAIDMLSTHPRQAELTRIGAQNAARMLGDGSWNYKSVPTMVYPMNKFDEAQANLETKYGKYMKSLINMEMEDGEPYMV